MFKNLFHIVINKLCPWLAAVSLVVLALTTGTAGLAKAETTVDCLVLHQRDLKAGKMTVYFAGDVVRVDAMNGQGTIISRAPDWNVLIFNRDKQSIKVGPKEWHMRGLDRIMKSKREFKWKPAKDQYLGYKVTTATRIGCSGTNVDDLFRTKNKTRQPVSSKNVLVTYIGTKQLGLSKGEYEFAQGLYLTPPEGSVLLATFEPGESSFTTSSIKKKKVPLSLFVSPKKLIPAHSITAVLTGRGIEEMLLNFSGAK